MTKRENFLSIFLIVAFTLLIFVLVNNHFLTETEKNLSNFFATDNFCSKENLKECRTIELEANLLNILNELKNEKIVVLESQGLMAEINKDGFLVLNEVKDVVSEPVINEVEVLSITENSAKIILKNFDDGGEECRVSLECDNKTLTFSEKIKGNEVAVFELSSLDPQTKYTFILKTSNSKGRDLYRGVFETQAPDLRIEEINVETGTKIAQLSFAVFSEENVDIILEYGEDEGYNTVSSLKNKPAGDYYFNLTKLEPGNEYFYKLQLKIGERTVEERGSFKTLDY